ncbi:MAG: hypothetical protein IPL87_02495 [Candidatus Moraniibacteriota bacterium]|nr:MAG: hypothetical protein IPL87_02495 [Candidatus Moranbacteria bacterium]
MIDDNNIAYEFHFYEPHPFTHQLFDWSALPNEERYPDESIVNFSNSAWHSAHFGNPALSFGTSEWTFYEGNSFTINDPAIKMGVPVLMCISDTGTAFFDDMTLKEYDAGGNFVRDVLAMSLDDMNGWGYWSATNTGSASLAATGHSNGKSIAIAASGSDANVSHYGKVFLPKSGFSYRMSGWMKGESIGSAAECKFRMDFLSTTGPVYTRDKPLLEAEIQKYKNWATTKNVPLYIGEFGAGRYTFEENRGGLRWVEDVIDIAKAKNISFSYHDYHEDNFGLYFGFGSLPTPGNANTALINLLTEKLR